MGFDISSGKNFRCFSGGADFFAKGIGVVLMGGLLLAGCGKSQPPEVVVAKNEFGQATPELDRKAAMKAVLVVESMLDALQGGGGYQEWTAKRSLKNWFHP